MRNFQKFRFGYLLSVMILFALPCFIYGQNKSQSNDKEILQDLLNEVRLLRQTLQRQSLYSYRGQILLEQIRARQDHVLQSTHTLENIWDEIQELEIQDSDLVARLKELSEQTAREADPKQREEIEDEIKAIKQTQSQQNQRKEELRKRESQLSSTLREEQVKLDALEKRLEAIENELERGIEGATTRARTKERKRTYSGSHLDRTKDQLTKSGVNR